MFTYVSDTSHWEPWMHEYRYGLILIMPPPEVMAFVDELRARYDPRSASHCQAHISLSEPLPRPLTPELLEEVRGILAGIEPFEITYGPLRTFPPYPGVTYRVEPEERFFALRRSVEGASLFQGSEFKRSGRKPHMTIAEFLPDIEASERLREELQGKVPEGSFLCDRLEYIVPNRDFWFERVLELPLGGG